MLVNKLLKGLLGASAVAAMLAAVAVQAQTAQSGAQQGSQSTTGQGTSGTSGQGATGAGTVATASTLSKGDQKILMNMAQGNMAEIELARLAQSKSQNDQVKTFSQQMIDDHTKAMNEIQQLATSKGLTLPTALDKRHKAEVDKLSGMSGDAFDKAYMARAGVSDHKRMHSMLASAESKAKDPDVKALAARLTPTVDQHLKAAEQISGAKGSSTAAKPSAATGAGQ